MNTSEALEKLTAEGITSSAQMLRRWIRQGKIEANMLSKKQGYLIDESSLDNFIMMKKTAVSAKKDHTGKYEEGYAAASEKYEAYFKRLIKRGMFESSSFIRRSDFREYISGKISENRRSEFLKYCDQLVFKRGVATPRKSEEVLQLGKWIYFFKAGILLDRNEISNDHDLTVDDLIMLGLFNYLRVKFMEEVEDK